MNFPHLSSLHYFWFLLAVALPVIVHLLNKRRFKTIQWAATSFLLKANKSSNKKRKLKQWIILSLRCLSVAAIILLIARPFTNATLLDNKQHKADAIIILLDCSPSMSQVDPNSGLSKLEAAVRLASENSGLLESQKIILIDSTSVSPLLLNSGHELVGHWKTKQSDKEANIPMMVDTALDYVDNNTIERAEIWVLSDLQASAWEISSSAWSAPIDKINTLRNKVELKLIPFNEGDLNKVDVEINHVAKSSDYVEITATVHQSSLNSRESLQLGYWIDGDSYNFDTPLLGAQTEFTKKFPSSQDTGYGYVEVIQGNRTNNTRSYFTYEKPTKLLSLVVSNDQESQQYLIASAKASSEGVSGFVQSVAPQQLLPLDQAQVLIWNAPLPTGAKAENIERFITRGGVALFLPPTEDSDNTFLENQWANTFTASEGLSFKVVDYNRSDGLLRDGNDGVAIPINELECIKFRTLNTNATSLAQWSNQHPALSRQIHGDGSLYFCTTLPNYFWSSLADGDVLLPLMKRLNEQASNSASKAQFYVVGSEQSVKIFNQNSWECLLPETSDSTEASLSAGVFSYDDVTFAQNRDPLEMRSSTLSMADILSFIPSASFTNNSNEKTPRPIWHLFAYLTVAFLIGESLLTASFPSMKHHKQQSQN